MPSACDPSDDKVRRGYIGWQRIADVEATVRRRAGHRCRRGYASRDREQVGALPDAAQVADPQDDDEANPQRHPDVEQAGKMDVRAATPAAIDTATVRT